MGNFNRDDRGRGGYENREMFKATCADCGKSCEIPFRPTTGRPVYCSDCFRNHAPQGESRGRDNNPRGRDTGRGNSRSFGNDKPMFSAICDNCGDKCKVPFEPREGKETLCSKCFEEKGGDPRRSQNASSPMLNDINAKLDRILELLSPTVSEQGKPEKKEKKAKSPVKEIVETPVEEVSETVETPLEAAVEIPIDETIEVVKPVKKAKKPAAKKS